MKKGVSLFFVILLLCAGCQKATRLSASLNEIKAASGQGKYDVTISTDGGDIEVEYNPEWVKTTVTDSTLTCEVADNDSYDVRDDSVVIASGDLKCTIPIHQVYSATYLKTVPDNLVFPLEGGTQTVKVESDGKKIELKGAESCQKKLENGTLTITVPANTSMPIVEVLDVICDGMNNTVLIKQAGHVCKTCKGTGEVACKLCNGTGIDAQSYACAKCMIKEDHHKKDEPVRGSGKMDCPECKGVGL